MESVSFPCESVYAGGVESDGTLARHSATVAGRETESPANKKKGKKKGA